MPLIVRDLAGNRQRLDGGAMFGNVPRAMWSRWIAPDELGRVELHCRCALVTHGSRRILLETGIGCFLEPKLKERYGVVEDEHVLLRSLGALGLSHADIDVVVLSHLHFDHAGGLLAPYAAGAAQQLLFPNAEFITSQAAFDRALTPHPRDRASFIKGLTQLLQQSGRLTLLSPGQRQLPQLGPEFEFLCTEGHTPGMLHTWVRGAQQNLFFCADLVPGQAWVHLPVTMGYDRFAEGLIDEKSSLFPRLERDKTWLFFTHDTEVAAAQLRRDDQGRYAVSHARKTLAPGFDLDAAGS